MGFYGHVDHVGHVGQPFFVFFTGLGWGAKTKTLRSALLVSDEMAKTLELRG